MTKEDEKNLKVSINNINNLYKELLINLQKCLLVNGKIIFNEDFDKISAKLISLK